MAARENQLYFIFVIILFLIALVLGLLAFLGYSRASEQGSLYTTTKSDLDVQKKLTDAYQLKSQILESYVGGFGPSVAEVQTSIDRLQTLSNGLDAEDQASLRDIEDQVKAIKEVYDADMRSMITSGEGDEAQENTWRGLVVNLSKVLGKKHNELYIMRNEATRAENNARAQIAGKEKEVEQIQKTLTDLKDEFESAKQNYAKQEQTLTTALEDNRDENDKLNRRYEDAVQSATAEKKRLNSQMTEVANQNAALKTKINVYEQENFDLPDGKVTKVSPSINMVYLNIGRLDGLRPNRSFVIYDRSVSNFEKEAHKASITVTRIMGDHEAEARVTSEDPLTPILTGDHILTATWDPGYSVPIALAGRFDIDGDGEDDTLRLVQMIKNNGGTVAAQHDDSGNIKGVVDAKVRYLVIGEIPEQGPDINRGLFEAVDELKQQAKNNTVEIIDMRKLLNWMGQHGRSRIEYFDGRSGKTWQDRSPSDTLRSNDR